MNNPHKFKRYSHKHYTKRRRNGKPWSNHGMIYQQGRKMKNVLKLASERVHRMQILAGNTVSQVKWEWWIKWKLKLCTYILLKKCRANQHIETGAIVATPPDFTRILQIMAWVDRKCHSSTIWCGGIIRLISNCQEEPKYYEHKNFHLDKRRAKATQQPTF